MVAGRSIQNKYASGTRKKVIAVAALCSLHPLASFAGNTSWTTEQANCYFSKTTSYCAIPSELTAIQQDSKNPCWKPMVDWVSTHNYVCVNIAYRECFPNDSKQAHPGYGFDYPPLPACATQTTGTPTQSGSQSQAASISANASSQSASMGVVNLAEGVTSLDDAPAKAGIQILAGKDAIDTAAALKQQELQAGENTDAMGAGERKKRSGELTADQTILDSEAAHSILSKLEAKYGIDRKEFTQKVLATGGNTESLGEILGTKFSTDKLSAALVAGKELSEAEKKELLKTAEAAGIKTDDASSIVNLAAPLKTAGKGQGLRAALKQKLQESNESGASTAHTEITQGKKDPPTNLKGLTPAPADEFLNGRNPAQEELSLFDVVHRKYLEHKELY